MAQPDQASSGRATSDSSVVAGLGNTNSFQLLCKNTQVCVVDEIISFLLFLVCRLLSSVVNKNPSLSQTRSETCLKHGKNVVGKI